MHWTPDWKIGLRLSAALCHVLWQNALLSVSLFSLLSGGFWQILGAALAYRNAWGVHLQTSILCSPPPGIMLQKLEHWWAWLVCTMQGNQLMRTEQTEKNTLLILICWPKQLRPLSMSWLPMQELLIRTQSCSQRLHPRFKTSRFKWKVSHDKSTVAHTRVV